MQTPFRFLTPLLAAFLVVLSSGCKAAPPLSPALAMRSALAGVVYDPAAPLQAVVTPLGGGEAATYSVRYRGANGETVPGLLTIPGAARKPAPCILLLHGLAGSKGQMFLPAIVLARRGYASLAIDIAGHGDRPRLGGKDPGSLSLPEMRQVSAQTVIDLRRAVDLLATRSDIDPQRIGFLGLSLGGILGGVFTAEEPRVRAAALWSAGGDWGKLVTQSTHHFARRFRQNGATSEEAITRAMADVDPLQFVARIAPRPLLLINGTADTVVPAACADALYAAAREPKQRIPLPGGHVPDITLMLDRTLTWFDSRLKKQ